MFGLTPRSFVGKITQSRESREGGGVIDERTEGDRIPRSMSCDVRRGRLNTDPTAPVATGQTVKFVPDGETVPLHRVSKRSEPIGADEISEMASLVGSLLTPM